MAAVASVVAMLLAASVAGCSSEAADQKVIDQLAGSTCSPCPLPGWTPHPSGPAASACTERDSRCCRATVLQARTGRLDYDGHPLTTVPMKVTKKVVLWFLAGLATALGTLPAHRARG